MKKVVNVSVGGRSFSLDEDAYARLLTYFDHFKARLDRDTQSAKEEVMADLENRIAELFDQGTGGASYRVVNLALVTKVVEQLGMLADRLSVNIELPSEASLRALAPNKTKAAVLRPMRFIADRGQENRRELVKYRHAPRFAPAGQATQMIVGATGESDRHILTLTQSLYDTYHLKRVFYSAYVPVVENTLLPSLDTKPPLLREHRLYQADWLLRFYGFRAGELLDESQPDFDPLLDPKCCWALRHPDFFPVEVNRADYEALLRVPGIGVVSAKRILVARRGGALRAEDLKKLGVVLKRAQYFLTCSGRSTAPLRLSLEGVRRNLTATERVSLPAGPLDQLSLFEPA